MLTVGVLGPLEVRLDGERVDVPSGRCAEVLVRLALDAGSSVRSERLIEDVWDEEAASTGRNTLQSKVSQLRRALGAPDLVTSGNGGYALAVDPAAVDARRVVELAGEVSAHRRAGDATAALACAAEALALFRGDVLVDAGDGSWLVPHRAQLEEVRLALLEDQLAARVELGGAGEVVAELEVLVDRHPLREGLWHSLITALYRAGRQADALAAYQRVRRTLVDELGIEPGPALQALEAQVLDQTVTLAEPPAAPPPTLRAAAAPIPGNVPVRGASLVGRSSELDELRRLVDEERLVTLVGPGGVGKTRLATEVAREVRAPGGVWLVRLDALDDPATVGAAIGEVLQVAGGEPALRERLRGADTVLVVDNCEHVLDGVAELVASLLDHAPGLRVLATSQRPLAIDGEVVLVLDPLPIDDSVALFAQRAAAQRRPFALDDDAAATVAEVCRSLDGLPLAIELAAARVKSLSVADIARRLDDRFALLTDPNRRGPERRRALAGAIGWSYDLLFPDDQRGLWALSCFAGGATLGAVEQVLAALDVPAATALDVVDRLVDRSLVRVDERDDGEVRYRLLDSIDAFAGARLAETGLAAGALAAHARWCADRAADCDARVRGAAQASCLALVRAERANVDAALAWCAANDPALGVRIANGFGWTWVVLGDGEAGAARVRAALAAAGPALDARERTVGLLLSGWLEASAGDVDRADRELDEAARLGDELGDEQLRADVDRHQAFLRIQQGRPAEVVAAAEASLATYRARGDDWACAGSLLLAAFGSIMVDDTGLAARRAEEALGLLEPIGDRWGVVHGQAMLGAIAEAEGDLARAAAALAAAATASEENGFLGQAALHLTSLGRVRRRAGERDAASATLDQAIAAAERSGDLRISAAARVELAQLRLDEGETDVAEQLLAEADAWYRRAGGGDGAGLAHDLLAQVRAGSAAPAD